MTHKQALFLYWGIMADLRIPAYDFLRKKQKKKEKKNRMYTDGIGRTEGRLPGSRPLYRNLKTDKATFLQILVYRKAQNLIDSKV